MQVLQVNQVQRYTNRYTEFFSLLCFTLFIIALVYFGETHKTNEYIDYYYYFLAIFAVIMVIVSPEKGLYIFIVVSMFSPEISISRVGRRNVIIRFDDLMICISIIVWIIIRIIKKEIKFFVSTPLDKPIFAFILISTLSTARGVLIGQVERPLEAFLYVLKMIEYFFIYYLVVNTVKNKNEMRRYITIFIITLFFTCLVGLQQMQQGVARVSTPFEDSPEPNTMGGYLLFMFAITSALAIMGAKIFTNFFLWCFLPLIIWVFLHTLSRGSYLGYFPVLVALTFLMPKNKRIYSLIILILSIVLIPYLPDYIKGRIDRTFQGPGEFKYTTITGEEKKVNLDSSSSSRITKYENVINYWSEYPIFGLGITGAGFVDSTIFRTIGELGIMGMLTLIWLFYSMLSETFNAYRYSRNNLNKGLCIGYICGMIGLIIHATTANTFFLIRIMGPFWFLTGLIFMIPPLYFDEIAKPYGKRLITDDIQIQKRA